MDAGHLSRQTETIYPGLVEMLFSFRRHRSTPSRRISRIREVRSR
jgi:hypothetical protein